jgi:hypothetical protein
MINNIEVGIKDNNIRDLYKRDARLRYWIDIVKHEPIPDADKQDILKFRVHAERGEVKVMDNKMHNLAA